MVEVVYENSGSTQAFKMRKETTGPRAYALVLMAGVLWSGGAVIVRHIEVANEWQILFYRSVSIAVTLFALLAARSQSGVIRAFRSAGLTAVVAGLCLATSFVCFIFSVMHTTVANTMFLLTSGPFMSAALGRILLGERPRSATWGAMGIAVVGVALMVGEGLVVGGLFGDITALGSALGFAGFTVALRAGRSVEMLPAVCLAGLFGAIATGTVAHLFGHGLAIPVHDLLLCVIYGSIVIGLGLFIYIIGSRHLPAAELTVLCLSEVVLAPIWVWLGVGEVPSAMTFFGGGIVLAAVIGQAMSGMRNQKPAITLRSPLA